MIVIKDVIISKKIKKNKMLSEDIVDITILAKVAQVSSPVYHVGRYKWVMSNADINAAK